MSFFSNLIHRCDLYESRITDNDGSPVARYVKVNDLPIRCRIDLNFVRQGKDSLWNATAARPDDRTGVMFFLPNQTLRDGMRAEIVRGPSGIFQFKGAIDEAWDHRRLHHFEVGVVEVSTLQSRGEHISTP